MRCVSKIYNLDIEQWVVSFLMKCQNYLKRLHISQKRYNLKQITDKQASKQPGKQASNQATNQNTLNYYETDLK